MWGSFLVQVVGHWYLLTSKSLAPPSTSMSHGPAESVTWELTRDAEPDPTLHALNPNRHPRRCPRVTCTHYWPVSVIYSWHLPPWLSFPSVSPPNAGAGDLLKSSDKKNAASLTWITLLTWCSLCLGQINGLTPQFREKKLKQIFQKKKGLFSFRRDESILFCPIRALQHKETFIYIYMNIFQKQ